MTCTAASSKKTPTTRRQVVSSNQEGSLGPLQACAALFRAPAQACRRRLSCKLCRTHTAADSAAVSCSSTPGALHTHLLRFLVRLLGSRPKTVDDLRAAGIWELAFGHRFFFIGDTRYRCLLLAAGCLLLAACCLLLAQGGSLLLVTSRRPLAPAQLALDSCRPYGVAAQQEALLNAHNGHTTHASHMLQPQHTRPGTASDSEAGHHCPAWLTALAHIQGTHAPTAVVSHSAGGSRAANRCS